MEREDTHPLHTHVRRLPRSIQHQYTFHQVLLNFKTAHQTLPSTTTKHHATIRAKSICRIPQLHDKGSDLGRAEASLCPTRRRQNDGWRSSIKRCLIAKFRCIASHVQLPRHGTLTGHYQLVLCMSLHAAPMAAVTRTSPRAARPRVQSHWRKSNHQSRGLNPNMSANYLLRATVCLLTLKQPTIQTLGTRATRERLC